MDFNKKQIIILSIFLALIYFSFLMTKDVIRNYDKEKVDKQRQEYVAKRLEPYKYTIKMPKWQEYEFKAEAELKFPYGIDTKATKVLFLKFKGEYYKYKFWIVFFLLTIGSLLLYNLREKNSAPLKKVGRVV